MDILGTLKGLAQDSGFGLCPPPFAVIILRYDYQFIRPAAKILDICQCREAILHVVLGMLGFYYRIIPVIDKYILVE